LYGEVRILENPQCLELTGGGSGVQALGEALHAGAALHLWQGRVHDDRIVGEELHDSLRIPRF